MPGSNQPWTPAFRPPRASRAPPANRRRGRWACGPRRRVGGDGRSPDPDPRSRPGRRRHRARAPARRADHGAGAGAVDPRDGDLASPASSWCCRCCARRSALQTAPPNARDRQPGAVPDRLRHGADAARPPTTTASRRWSPGRSSRRRGLRARLRPCTTSCCRHVREKDLALFIDMSQGRRRRTSAEACRRCRSWSRPS